MWRSTRGRSSGDFEGFKPGLHLDWLQATVHDASESGDSGSEDLVSLESSPSAGSMQDMAD